MSSQKAVHQPHMNRLVDTFMCLWRLKLCMTVNSMSAGFNAIIIVKKWAWLCHESMSN